jgi:hypothetical protein
MLNVHLEASCGPALQSIFVDGTPAYFRLVAEADSADVVVFEKDDWSYLRRSELLRRHPNKCICISEWDKPSFVIPAIYASNEKAWYSRGRTETMNYPIADRRGRNPWVTALAAQTCGKTYLYSFVGKSSSRVRKRLFRHYVTRRQPSGDVFIEASDEAVINQAKYSDAVRRRYAEIISASKFALCPRGWGTSSVRLFEACEMGVAPVILADRWIPIGGIDWSFALFVDEGRISELDAIIRSHGSEWRQRGERARQTFLQHFAVDAAPRALAAAMERLLGSIDPRREAAIHRWYPLIHIAGIGSERLRKWFPAFRA